MAAPRIPIEDRFWTKVDRSGGPESCWEWTAQRSPDGYGRISVGKSSTAAHRVSYAWEKGPIPAGWQIDHLCRNPPCVNPVHLEAVTPLENQRRISVLRTHCKHGHEFTPENTYWFGPERRYRACIECRRRQQSGIADRVAPFRHRPRITARR